MYRAVYNYAWDPPAEGLADRLAELRDHGINAVTLACAYHAEMVPRPRARGETVYFPEDF